MTYHVILYIVLCVGESKGQRVLYFPRKGTVWKIKHSYGEYACYCFYSIQQIPGGENCILATGIYSQLMTLKQNQPFHYIRSSLHLLAVPLLTELALSYYFHRLTLRILQRIHITQLYIATSRTTYNIPLKAPPLTLDQC